MRRCHIVWSKLLALLGRFLAVLPTMTCTRVFIIVGCLTLASSGGPVAAAAPAGQSLATPVPRESLEPFLNRYCIDCHNADDANGPP